MFTCHCLTYMHAPCLSRVKNVVVNKTKPMNREIEIKLT